MKKRILLDKDCKKLLFIVNPVAGRKYILEFEDARYEKPIITRSLPFLSNHISKEEGVLGTYLVLNGNLQPALQIRFAAPATAESIWKRMTMDKWTITYKGEDKIEDARLSFDKPGVVKAYVPEP